jgi:hypothetical protein
LLQKEWIKLVSVQEIFNNILEDYPELKGRLADDAGIVVDVTFKRCHTECKWVGIHKRATILCAGFAASHY